MRSIAIFRAADAASKDMADRTAPLSARRGAIRDGR